MDTVNYPQEPAQDRKSNGHATLFAADFQTLVIPRLARLAIAEARCVAAGVASYGEACDAVMAYAAKCGATYLQADDHHALEDWVAARVRVALETALAQGWDRRAP